jgi:hypothetical protein
MAFHRGFFSRHGISLNSVQSKDGILRKLFQKGAALHPVNCKTAEQQSFLRNKLPRKQEKETINKVDDS